jgi:LmbE family N-acetylglucosaminyl deacetylase
MKVLVIAPHADDEIIGVGGSIAKHIAQNNKVYICIVTKGTQPIFEDDYVNKIREETIMSHSYIGIEKTFFLDFPAVMLEQIPRHEINDKILTVVSEVEPDIVYIPHFGDMQKDHQIIAEAAMVALRPKYKHKVKAVYAYETLSETEWNIPHAANAFIPNVYVDVTGFIDKKIEAMKLYESQLADFPNPRSLEAIEALAKYRGSTINVKAAEAFMLIREIM